MLLASLPPSRVVASTLCCALAATAVVAAAAEEQKRSYRFPRGEAAAVLAQFATESGRPILFMMEVVRGEHTNALSGTFTPREALDRLLAGTGLVAVHDPKSGGFIVNRRPTAGPAGRKQAADSGSPPTADNQTALRATTMQESHLPSASAPGKASPPPASSPARRRSPFTWLAGWLALMVGPGSAALSAEAGAPTGAVQGRVQNVQTGQYLNNARVSVRGTDLVVFSDIGGTYRLGQMPAGSATLEVFYTGLAPQTATVSVSPGQTVTRDFDLTGAGQPDQVVAMNAFVVRTQREVAGDALAINEQRFAANIKNVVAADTFGDIVEGSVGEFMKYMPGVVVEYIDINANSVSVRGLGSNTTGVTVDGAHLAQANTAGSNRAFEFKQVSINNISRIEVTKVPTPSDPADTIGGAVNMVSKSAFERRSAEFNYSVYLSGNGDSLSLQRLPTPHEKRKLRVNPGFNLEYVLPVNDRLGLVFGAISANNYSVQDIGINTYSATGTSTGASIAAPYLQAFQHYDAPKYTRRNSASLKLDWKPGIHSQLSLGLQFGHYVDENMQTNWTANAGTNGTPTVAGGRSLSYARNTTEGATGRGAVTPVSFFQYALGVLRAASTRYRFNDGIWEVNAGASLSDSLGSRHQTKHGYFEGLTVSLRNPVRLSFNAPSQDPIVAYDNNERVVDLSDPANYQVTGAISTPRKALDNVSAADLSLRRALGFLPFAAKVQLGGSVREQERDSRRDSIVWDYTPPGGDRSPLPFLGTVYQPGAEGRLPRVPKFSPDLAWQAHERDPSLFTQTPARLVAAETFRITNSLFMRETVSALFLKGEARLLKNRLFVVTGVRYERTENDGLGPLYDPNEVFQRNADGTFRRDAAGQRIRKPEAGAAGSMDELRLTRFERAFRVQRSYGDYYPSLHLNYNVTDDLVIRAAYALTYARPNFVEIMPVTTVNEFDVSRADGVPGTITVNNAALRPWTADNYDLSLEYYSPTGSVITAGVFRKDISDFFGSAVRIATPADLAALDLDPRYVGWQITTKFNAGRARVTGVEASWRQSLKGLGGIGRHFSVFLNATRLKLEGSQDADFTTFIPEIANGGVTFSRSPVTVTARGNYRGQTRGTLFTGLGPDAYTREEARTTMDLNVDVAVSRRLTLFANARNVFDVPWRFTRYGASTPDYARAAYDSRRYGIQLNVGAKGSF